VHDEQPNSAGAAGASVRIPRKLSRKVPQDSLLRDEQFLADAGSDSSEDERPDRNTIGAVPLEWYKDEEHIGYDRCARSGPPVALTFVECKSSAIHVRLTHAPDCSGSMFVCAHRGISPALCVRDPTNTAPARREGAPLARRPRDKDMLDAVLARNDSPGEALRTIYDPYNDEELTLSKEELRVLMNIQRGRTTDVSIDPHADLVDWYSNTVDQAPMQNGPEPKRRFMPSKWEEKKVVKLARSRDFIPSSRKSSSALGEPARVCKCNAADMLDEPCTHKLRCA
jgi:BOP1NT (NUC169) domain